MQNTECGRRSRSDDVEAFAASGSWLLVPGSWPGRRGAYPTVLGLSPGDRVAGTNQRGAGQQAVAVVPLLAAAAVERAGKLGRLLVELVQRALQHFFGVKVADFAVVRREV